MTSLMADAERHEYFKQIAAEKQDIEEMQLPFLKENKTIHGHKIVRAAQREVWMLNGILEYNLACESLKKVVDNFNKIDQVPSGYDYPELCQSEKIPDFLVTHVKQTQEFKNLNKK